MAHCPRCGEEYGRWSYQIGTQQICGPCRVKDLRQHIADLTGGRMRRDKRIKELEAAGDALEKGIRCCTVRCRYIPLDELVALQKTWRRTRGG